MGFALRVAGSRVLVCGICLAAGFLLAGGISPGQAQHMPMERMGDGRSHSPAPHHDRTGGGAGGGILRDVGTGLAIGIIGGAIEGMSKPPAPAASSKPTAKPKVRLLPKSGKSGKSKPSMRKKQAAPPAPPADAPKKKPPARPAEAAPPPGPDASPPVTPETTAQSQDEPCEECFDLWNRIRRYQDLIAREQRELEDLERTKARREAESRDFRARAAQASDRIEGDYDNRMADLADQFVNERGELIESWKARIASERAFLEDLLTQFRQCVERFCAKLAATPEPPPEPAPEPRPEPAPETLPKEPSLPASAPFCPANANAAPVEQKLVHDYGANNARPPAPTDRIFRLGNIPEEVAWFALFSFYNGGQGRTSVADLVKDPLKPQPADAMPSGVPTDAVIVEGEVLDTIQQQGEVINQNNWAKFYLRQNADDMFGRLRCGQSGLFTNRGGQVVKGDPAATRVHLGFGSFSVYWDAVCEIGPKRCCIPDSDCESGWRNETLYHCRVKWTMYDTYNFSHKSGTGGTGPLKRINPLGWGGTPFQSFGYWDDVAGGVLRQCVGQ